MIKFKVIENAPKKARYDSIGDGYANFRKEDPVLARAIHNALHGSRTVVNFEAGSGSYEPIDIPVLAIEPSDVMNSQRGSKLPAIKANAESLPLHDKSFDAAMTVLSLHHWHPNQKAGILEMRRVARKKFEIVT